MRASSSRRYGFWHGRRRSNAVAAAGDDRLEFATNAFDQLAAELTSSGIFCTAVQACAIGPRGSIDTAVGELCPDHRLEASTLFNVHCATKPLAALALGLLIDAGSIDPSRPIRELVAAHSSFASIEEHVWSVMNHSAALARPLLVDVYFCPAADRPALVRAGVLEAKQGYSEHAAYSLVGELIERAVGYPAAEFITQEVLTPLGLSDEICIGLSSEQLQHDQSRVGFYTLGLPMRSIPLLHDRSPHVAHFAETNLGGYASARGLSGLYRALGRVYHGEAVQGLPSSPTLAAFLSHRCESRDDPVLGRRCSFAAGFMAALADHGYGDAVGTASFGHSGLLGASFAFYDPASGVAAAAIVNGLHKTQMDLDYVRGRIVSALIRAVGRRDLPSTS